MIIFVSLFTGPTSFAPIIDAAIDIVEESNGQYHVLVIIADGQVGETCSVPFKFSPFFTGSFHFFIIVYALITTLKCVYFDIGYQEP